MQRRIPGAGTAGGTAFLGPLEAAARKEKTGFFGPFLSLQFLVILYVPSHLTTFPIPTAIHRSSSSLA